jgi:hypothetical protein
MDEMPDVDSRVRFPWESGEREGVVVQQLGVGTLRPRVKIRPDGESADIELPIDVVEPVDDDAG